MATGTILLPVGGAELDATNPPGIGFAGSRRKLLFDDTTDQICYWVFRMPVDFASAPVAKCQYSMASAVANEITIGVAIYAVTDGDAQDLDADSYDAINYGTKTVPGTAGHLDEVSITLTNADSLAAGDWVAVQLRRDADQTSGAGNDDATGDLELWAVSLEYTTT